MPPQICLSFVLVEIHTVWFKMRIYITVTQKREITGVCGAGAADLCVRCTVLGRSGAVSSLLSQVLASHSLPDARYWTSHLIFWLLNLLPREQGTIIIEHTT